MKLIRMQGDADRVIYHCPGCGCSHMVAVNGARLENGAGWQLSGTPDAPTLSPSVLVRGTPRKGPDVVCHSFVRDGKIMFLADSTHALAGQTVPMVEWE